MKISHLLWLGSEESFYQHQALEAQFFGVAPTAVREDRDEEPEYDEVFGVRSDRIGLPLLEKVGSTTVLKVHGTISQRHAWWHSYFPGSVTSYEAIEDALSIAAHDENRSPVLMDFATGGGVVRGIDRTTRKIQWARQVLDINAHTDSSAFSAGFWLASTAKSISASAMGEVGSIGTLMVTYDMSKAAEKDGITYHVFRAGEYKALGLPYEAMDEKAANYIQEHLEKTNQFFLDHVSQQRGLSLADRGTWAEGKTFYARDALRVGLIDRVATLDEILGGSASRSLTSDNRRAEMKISAEKLAQITGGADPKDVLTETELKEYLASLETPEEAAEEPETPDTTEASEEAAEDAGDEDSDGKVTSMLALNKEIGRLEAKLEMAQTRYDDLQAKLDAKDSDITALSEVALVALGNLCVALGRTKETPSTATGIVAKFNELQGEMAKRFKTGQQSREAPNEEGEDKLRNFRHNY